MRKVKIVVSIPSLNQKGVRVRVKTTLEQPIQNLVLLMKSYNGDKDAEDDTSERKNDTMYYSKLVCLANLEEPCNCGSYESWSRTPVSPIRQFLHKSVENCY